MNFTSQIQPESTEPNFFMIVFVILIFALNFAFCRYMSIRIIKAGYVLKHPVVIVMGKNGKKRQAINTKVTTDEYKRLFLFWFIPFFGALSLIVLSLSAAGVITLKRATPKLFLNHI